MQELHDKHDAEHEAEEHGHHNLENKNIEHHDQVVTE